MPFLLAAVVAGAALAPAQNAKPVPPKLELMGRTFVAVVNGKKSQAYLDPVKRTQVGPVAKALYRKDDAFVVWDSRGLSIRKGKYLAATRLTGVPISRALWSADDSERHRVLLDVGGYGYGVAEVRGHCRVGSEVFFLGRWKRPDGSTWFDALVAIDMSKAKPGVRLMAALSETLNLSGNGPLLILKDGFGVFENREKTWAYVKVDTKGKKSAGDDYPGRLESIDVWQGGRYGLVERTDYATMAVSTYAPAAAKRTLVAECKGLAGWLPGSGRRVFWTKDDEALSIADYESGAKLKLDGASKFRKIGEHVVVWTEQSKPSSATLYSSERWAPLAKWAPAAVKPKPKP